MKISDCVSPDWRSFPLCSDTMQLRKKNTTIKMVTPLWFLQHEQPESNKLIKCLRAYLSVSHVWTYRCYQQFPYRKFWLHSLANHLFQPQNSFILPVIIIVYVSTLGLIWLTYPKNLDLLQDISFHDIKYRLKCCRFPCLHCNTTS